MRSRDDIGPSWRDRFRLAKQPLGQGSYAEVMLADPKDGSASVALKRGREVPQARERLRREIEALRRLQHPHVMKLLDSDPSYGWYTMPLARRTLDDLCTTTTAAEVVEVLRQVGSALAAAHSLRMLHRDLSLRNILDCGDDHNAHWVLADWGMVSAWSHGPPSDLTNGPIGTEYFMAPEVKNGRGATERSDIYALGMVVRRLLSTEAILAHANLARFVAATTQPAPDGRPATVDDALKLLVTEPVRSFLVWRYRDGSATTALVRLTPDGSVGVVAEQPGLHVADGPRLWSWVHSETIVRCPDWWNGYRDGREDSLRERKLDQFDLERFDTGTRHRVSPVEPRPGTALDHDIGYQMVPLGGAGHLLLLREMSWWFGGGAHGGVGARFRVVDVRTGDDVDEAFDAALGGASALWEVAQRLAQADDWVVGDLGLAVTCWRPLHAVDGGVTREFTEFQFTHSTAYAGSDSRWACYTRSVSLMGTDASHLKAGLPPAPAVLLAYLSELSSEAEAYGWSEVETAAAPAWLGQFGQLAVSHGAATGRHPFGHPGDPGDRAE